MLLFILSGCSFRESPTVLQLAPLPEEGKVCRITVLPFINQTEYKIADTLFYRIFTTQLLASGNYLISQEGDVRKIFRQMRIYMGRSPDLEQIRSLAGRLGSEIVISGTIVEMGESNSRRRNAQATSLAVIIRIMDTDSGRTLWTTYHRREGKQYRKLLHFGMVNTITELSKKVSEEIIEAWIDEGMQICTGE